MLAPNINCGKVTISLEVFVIWISKGFFKSVCMVFRAAQYNYKFIAITCQLTVLSLSQKATCIAKTLCHSMR